MKYSETAKYLRLIGHQVEETPHGVWCTVGHGFFARLPAYETAPPSEEEIRSLFKRYGMIGLKYSIKPGGAGKAGGVYFVRDRSYDFSHLQPRLRTKTRRGLENCLIRQMSFNELYRLGLPLNLDTLERQQRDDPVFSDPERWARFCRAGTEVSGVDVWGAFVEEELASYVVVSQVDGIVNIAYAMSRSDLMQFNSSPALMFRLTKSMMQQPAIEAVCYGPEGVSSSDGLDRYKQHLGFEKEPVSFVVCLRPILQYALLNRVSRQALATFGRRLPDNDLYRRIRGVLDIAGAS